VTAPAAAVPDGTGPPGPGAGPTASGGLPGHLWSTAAAAVRAVPAGGSIQLACHVTPDGDALGSMLGFGLGLRRLGYTPRATFPGPFDVPPPFAWLPGLDMLVPEQLADPRPDLLVCFDAASPGRLGELAGALERAGASIVLDHHASNPGFGGIPLVDPGAAATAVPTLRLLDELGVPLDAEIAECLYVALATDTGSFKFAVTTPGVHTLAARLLLAGVRAGEVSRRVFDSRPFGAVRLYGEVLGRTEWEPDAAGGHGLVWSYATLDDLRRHRQRPYVLEGLIDEVRRAEEADVACVLKQVGPDRWSVSLRSKGALDVAAVAIALGGGGHRSAAGFTTDGVLTEVLAAVRRALADAVAPDRGAE
jgi:phosphoesterase RecJ-like protein